ncbi:MAG: energy-coupling factor transporter transmembrane protein EcfT, partial [Microbacterium sp.]
ALRVASVALPGLLLSAHIAPFPLGDALMQQLRLPARPVLAIVMALQRALLLADQWQELGRIRRGRGLAGGGPLGRVRELGGRTLVFLVLAIRSATQLSIAMETRGILAWQALGVPRGRWRESVWRRRDTISLIAVVLLSTVPIAGRFV